MEVLSPYGKDALHELRHVYGLGSFEALEALVKHRLATDYGLRVRVLSAHIAFGLTMMLEADSARYFLKFWSSTNQPNLPTVFAYLEALVAQGIPAPVVVRRLDGGHAANLLENSVYDRAYLMRAAQGFLMDTPTVRKLESLAQTVASWHRVGAEFASGTIVDVRLEIQNQLPSILNALADYALAQQVGAWLLAHLERVSGLPSIRTHGDFRLCHVLCTGETVTGVIDADTSVVRTRLLDVAQAVVSHPNPARCALLNADEVEWLLRTYDAAMPLTNQERQAWPIVLLYTALEQWAESDRSDDERIQALIGAWWHRFGQSSTI